jgi:two-component sensor histidine kinase/PAS domain-containing protein
LQDQLTGPAEQQEANSPIALRIAILEDHPEDAELMVHELRRTGFAVEWWRMETETDFLAALESPPDLILADYRLPRMDAPRALELLRLHAPGVPCIVVSGAIGEDAAVEMMRLGATDYVLKDRLKRLGLVVRRALDEKRLREESRKAEEALRISELRFYSFMNNNPALAFIKDEDGRIVYINNTCERAWNTTLAACQGKLDHELWPEQAAGQLRVNDLAVLQSGKTSRVIEEVPLGDGLLHHMLSFRFSFPDVTRGTMLGGVSVDVTEQMRTEKALATALAAKEVLLKEVHHRVKNNLQVISSLLNMQMEQLADSAMMPVFRESQQRVQAMAMIHERLYGQDRLEQLDFRDYVENLAGDLFCAFGIESSSIALRLDLEEVWLDLDQSVPCGLILNELLTNALKYAFPGGMHGEVCVELKRGAGHEITLRVADTGVGLPAGFDESKSDTLGLKIVHILTHKLRGTLRRGTSSGTEFSLVFDK